MYLHCMGLDRCILTYPSWYHTEYFHCPQILCVLFISLPYHPGKLCTFLLFPEFCIFQNVIACQIGFFHFVICVSDSSMSLHGLIVHLISVLNNSLLSRSIIFIYLPTEVYLDCFQLLAIVNNAAINIYMQVFV